jgi:transposase-like protein
MGHRRSRFDEGFRSQAVELARQSPRPRYQIAAELGISGTTLGKWMNEKQESEPDEPLSASERKELYQLRLEKRDWVIEREILKKRRPSG